MADSTEAPFDHRGHETAGRHTAGEGATAGDDLVASVATFLPPPPTSPAPPAADSAGEAQGNAGLLDLPPLAPPADRPSPVPAHEAPQAETSRGGLHGALVSWVAHHRRSAAYLAPALAVLGVVHAVGMSGFPAPIDDEGTYVAEAWAVALHHQLTPYTYWYTHPPFGWMQIAGWGLATDGFRPSLPAVAMGRQFMLLCFLVTAALVFVIARRLGVRRGWAAAGVLALGLSPLAVYYERMAYLDNVAVPWLLAAFALALSPRRRLLAFAGSGACFAGAVLSKETVLIFLPALLWQAWQGADRKTRSFCLTALLATFLLLGATYPVYAALKGELLPGKGHVSLWSAVTFQLVNRPGSGSVLAAGSQAHDLVAGWLHIDPWLLGLGVAGLPVAFAVRRFRPVAAAYLIGCLVALKGGYLPVPYVVALLPFAALVFSGAVDALWTVASSRGPSGARRARVLSAWGVRAAVVAGVAAVVVSAAPAWASADAHAMTVNEWGPLHRSEAWVIGHVPHRDRLLVSDTMWVDLVDNGFDQKLGVVWFYKLGYVNNLDPSVTRRLPGGWRDFQYIVSTPSLRGALAVSPGQMHQVRAALAHSVPVRTFGRGPNRIVIRRIGRRRAGGAVPASTGARSRVRVRATAGLRHAHRSPLSSRHRAVTADLTATTMTSAPPALGGAGASGGSGTVGVAGSGAGGGGAYSPGTASATTGAPPASVPSSPPTTSQSPTSSQPPDATSAAPGWAPPTAGSPSQWGADSQPAQTRREHGHH